MRLFVKVKHLKESFTKLIVFSGIILVLMNPNESHLLELSLIEILDKLTTFGATMHTQFAHLLNNLIKLCEAIL